MATLTIKNIPDELYERLKASAEANRRSINSEVIMIIEQALFAQPVDVEATLERARILRESLALYVTEDEINAAKNEGRP